MHSSTAARRVRLAIIRQSIRDGSYESLAKIHATVDAIMDELLSDPSTSPETAQRRGPPAQEWTLHN